MGISRTLAGGTRISARHFPVMVLLRDDPQTQNVYRYYTDMINTMLETPAPINY
jgi:hypothetical protein